MSAADDKVKAIREETARRKKLWNQLVETVRQAYAAVNREAKRRGITDGWIGNRPYTIWLSVFNVASAPLELSVKATNNGKVTVQLKTPTYDSRLYGGYPELSREDLEGKGFAAEPALDAIVEQLMEILNESK